MESQEIKSETVEVGRWTEAQQEKFILGIMNFGKDWKKIQELVKTRTGSQVRSHAQKFFLKISKINKQRKKQKKKQKPYTPSEFQRDFSQYFREQYLTDDTPSQIKAFMELAPEKVNKFPSYKQSRDQKKQLNYCQGQINKELSLSGQLSAFLPVNQPRSSFLESSTVAPENGSDNRLLKQMWSLQGQPLDEQNNQQSYLTSFIRQNFDVFESTHDILGLIDFSKNPELMKPQQKTIRKQSFHVYEQAENSEKLQKTLENLRQNMNQHCQE